MAPPLPTDVFRLVFGHLEADDVRVVRRVCKEFLELSNLRSVWDALLKKQAVQKNIPIPGLNGRSIESLSAQQLEFCLHRALSLRRNWTSEEPIVKRRISLLGAQQNRIVSVQFAPGSRHRRLISLSMSQRRSFILQCWDLQTSACVATRELHRFAGMAINKTESDSGIIAILNPHVEFIDLDLHAADPEEGFVTLNTIPEEIHRLHFFSGSSVVASDGHGRLFVRDLTRSHLETELQNPELTQNTPLVDIIITRWFILALRLTTLEMYVLPQAGGSANNAILQPIYVYKLPWRVDNAVMTIRHRQGERERELNDIYIVLRYGSYYPWAINLLHHYEIRPSRFFNKDGAMSAANLPYQFPPVLQETIASPVRLHAISDLALGPYGTVIWTDSHTEDYFNHADRGQRLAGRFSTYIMEGDDDEVELSDQIATASAASVYAYHEEDSWVRVALDETEGRIALGRDDGLITILEFV